MCLTAKTIRAAVMVLRLLVTVVAVLTLRDGSTASSALASLREVRHPASASVARLARPAIPTSSIGRTGWTTNLLRATNMETATELIGWRREAS